MEWKLSESLKSRYTEWFLQQSRGRDSVPICSFFVFMRTLNVKERHLEKIWNLCIGDPTIIRLHFAKFIIASFIADKVASGSRIPEVFPIALVDIEHDLILDVPRTCSEEAELVELYGTSGMETVIAKDIFGFIETGFPPCRAAVWRVLALLSLHPPNRQNLSTMLTPELLFNVIQKDANETTKTHAATFLSSITSADPLWMQNCVCLATTMAVNSAGEISAHLLCSIGHSSKHVDIFDKLFLSKPPYGFSNNYIDELTIFVSSPRLHSNTLEELVNIFLNIACTCNSEKPLGFVVSLIKTAKMDLLTPQSFASLCVLVGKVWNATLCEDVRIFSIFFTLVDRSILLHAEVAEPLTSVLLTPSGSNRDRDDRVALMQIIFHNSLNNPIVVSNCVHIVCDSVQTGTDKVGMLHVIQKASDLGSTETILKALDCWKELMLLTNFARSGSDILGSLLRGGNLEFFPNIFEIFSLNPEIVKEEGFIPFWSDLVYCDYYPGWGVAIKCLAPHLKSTDMANYVVNKCLDILPLEQKYLVDTLALLVHVDNEKILPVILPFLSESYESCLACLSVRLSEDHICAVLRALSDLKTPGENLVVLTKCIKNPPTKMHVKCMSIVMSVMMRNLGADELVNTGLQLSKEILSYLNPDCVSEMVPSRMHALSKLMAQGKFQTHILAVFTLIGLAGKISWVSNAIGVGSWFMSYLTKPPTTCIKLGMMAMLVSTQSRFRHLQLPKFNKHEPIYEYFNLHFMLHTGNPIPREELNRMWKHVTGPPGKKNLSAEIFSLQLSILSKHEFDFTSQGVLSLSSRVHENDQIRTLLLTLKNVV